MRYPAWYVWLALVVSTVASAGFSAVVSANTAQRALERERASQVEAAEQGRLATCNVVRTQLAIYAAAPPSTPTGREAVEAWGVMKDLYRCA